MSKRLRLENERCLAIKDEEKEEEDKLKLMRERIYAPIVWKRLTSGISVQDIKEKDYQRTLDFIKEYFMSEDVLCKNTMMLEDELSTKSFLAKCLFHLKDTTSLMAVDESNEDELVAILLMRVVHKDDYGRVFSRTIMSDGEAQVKCVQLKTTLNRKVDIYADFNCDTFIRIYMVNVKPEYRRKGIGFMMMRCSQVVARSLRVPVMMGIFGTCSLQRCAKKLGFEVMTEINYVEWRDKDKNLVFDDPGAGNYTCALMAGRVPAEVIPEVVKPVAVQTVVEEPKQKTTRKDRQEAKQKKKK